VSRRALVLLAALAPALGGCAGVPSTTVDPVPVDGGGAAAVQNDGGTSDAGPGAPVRRTVLERNPLGGPAGNLLVDGDFEMSAIPALDGYSQLGWSAYDPSFNQIPLLVETGGTCRTGLRCMILQANMEVYADGAAAGGAGNLASLWAKPPPGAECGVIEPVIVTCYDGNTVVSLTPDPAPGSDGWCGYRASVGPSSQALCLYVQSTLAGAEAALVDSGVLAPDDGTVLPPAAGARAPSAEDSARIHGVVDAHRKAQSLRRPPVRVMEHRRRP
jgi:hypothetical protein